MNKISKRIIKLSNKGFFPLILGRLVRPFCCSAVRPYLSECSLNLRLNCKRIILLNSNYKHVQFAVILQRIYSRLGNVCRQVSHLQRHRTVHQFFCSATFSVPLLFWCVPQSKSNRSYAEYHRSELNSTVKYMEPIIVNEY